MSAAVSAEVCYLLDTRAGSKSEAAFLWLFPAGKLVPSTSPLLTTSAWPSSSSSTSTGRSAGRRKPHRYSGAARSDEFPLLFFKWVSDTWDFDHTAAVKDFGDDVAPEVEADYHRFAVPDECHWADLKKVSTNVGVALQNILGRLAEANPETLAGISGRTYTAWTKAEFDEVGRAYEELVSELRKVAGKTCHDAWLASPASDDEGMNFPPGVVDLSALMPYKDAFAAVAQKHLKGMLKLRRLARPAQATPAAADEVEPELRR